MNYQIYEKTDGEKIVKRVLFEDGTDYCVNTDKEGREYFPVPNILIDNPENNPFKKLFIGKIKDAIETIRNGDGDVIGVNNLFGKTESVYKYVDREYGEEQRQKTIEGFKDTEFGYSIKFGYLNSMGGSHYVSKDKKILSIFDFDNSYIYFETEEEAERFKQEILTEAKKIADGYNKVKDDEGQAREYLDKYYNDSIYAEVGFAMMPDGTEDSKWKLEVVQVIKNS